MPSRTAGSLDASEINRSSHSSQTESSARGVTRRDGNCFVAIIEDDICVLRSMERLLRTAGCRTQTFTSGEEFLSALNSHVFSCVVLDVRLQGMNGLELQGQLLRSHHEIPIVFVTAVDLEEVKAAALKAGAIAYLPKPVDSDDLLNAVHSALRGVLAKEHRNSSRD